MMKRRINFKTIFLILLFVLGCNSSAIDDNSILYKYNFESKDNRVIKLPKELKEASGLVCFDDNHLITHNDEEGIVFKIDVKSGEVVSECSIGKQEIEKDFEGIAVANDSVYLVTSEGTLFKFELSDGTKAIGYEKINTPLSSKNDVEGLCYNEQSNSLLLACKDDPGKGFKNYKAVYEFNLTEMKFVEKPRFLIPVKELNQKFDIKDFLPSGIEINPYNGNIFLISANPEAIIELDNTGKLLNAKKMNDKNHKQPEGITFLNDGTMIIADESNGKKAKLTVIPFTD